MKKSVGVTSLLAALIATPTLVLIFPAIDTDHAAQVAFLLIIAIHVFARKAIWRRPSGAFWLFLAVALLFGPLIVIDRAFGHVDLLSLFFHLQYEIGFGAVIDLKRQIDDTYISLIVLALALLWLANYHGFRRWPYGLAVLFLVALNGAIAVETLRGKLIARDSNLIAELVTPVTMPPPQRPDVVLIYMEGVERTFRDLDGFRGAYAPLAALAEQGLEFTAIRQIEGTGWSIAGEVATQCGLPLVPNGLRIRNAFKEQEAFLANQVCLSDLLADEGYQIALAIGSDIHFAGHNHFAANHSITHIMDRYAIEATTPPDEFARALDGWVVDDQAVFDAGATLYEGLIMQDAPVFMTVATNGPHGDIAFLSRDCLGAGDTLQTEDLAESITCHLELLLRFLARIQASKGERPMMIGIMSDHLNHSTMMANNVDIDSRTNTVIFLSDGYTPPVAHTQRKIAKPGAMIDVYPTLLAYLGMLPVEGRAGLGVSLLGSEQGLITRLGRETLDAFIAFDTAFARTVWR